jgi:hypothetical protein
MHMHVNCQPQHQHKTLRNVEAPPLRFKHSHSAPHLPRTAQMPQTLYPRGTVKKIIKAHSARPLSKNVDILVRLSTTYTLSFPG